MWPQTLPKPHPSARPSFYPGENPAWGCTFFTACSEHCQSIMQFGCGWPRGIMRLGTGKRMSKARKEFKNACVAVARAFNDVTRQRQSGSQ